MTNSIRTGSRLQTQLLLGLVAVVSIPLFVFAIVGGSRLAARADGVAAQYLSVEAQTVAERVDEYLQSHQRGISLVASGSVAAIHPKSDFSARLHDLSSAYGDFLSLLVADSTGRIVAAHVPGDSVASRTATKRSIADRRYFRAVMETNTPFLSGVFRGRGVGTDAIVAISSPIRDRSGRPKGIVEGSLNLRRFELFARGALARASGRVIIVDREGRVVFASSASGFQVLQDVKRTSLGNALSRESSTNTISFTDAVESASMLGAVATTTKNGWRVVVAQPHRLAREEGRTYLLTILVGLGLAAIVAVILAIRLASHVTRPIEELIEALRSFDVRAPRPVMSDSHGAAPEEISALVREFDNMSARVRHSADAQHASDSRFRAIFDHAAIGIAVHDSEGRFVDSNPAFQQILGYSAEELRNRRASELSSPEEAAVTREPVRSLKSGLIDKVQVEKTFIHRDGRSITCELTVSRLDVTGEPDSPGGLVGMLQDVTDRRRLERDVVWRANHDTLTGLANRTNLRERLGLALQRMRVPGSVAVLLLDLDQFKRVNDLYGHSIGDHLLCEVSRRLLSATRGCDVVARLGGDEFAVVLDGADYAVFADIAAKRILQSLKRPISAEGAELVLSTSIGIAYAGVADTVDSLIRNADTAMYRAKHAGKGTFDVFTDAMHEEVLAMLSLENDLRQAVELGQLRAAFQPIIDLRSGTAVGAECLIRWDRVGHGTISPSQFIPLAEQTGLIVAIGRWVLNEACRHGAQWLSQLPHPEGETPPFSITVNVSSKQLQHPSLIADVREALARSGLDPRALVLELTESVVLSETTAAIERLHELRALGIRLAIDDFGTGYSSLSYLQVLPVDILKLDKSFIDRIATSSRDADLVRTIIGLAHSLSLRCVAEGVEHPEQRRMLTDMGCGFAQGYLFARPLDPEAAGRVLTGRSEHEQAA